jgi:hypothetical protein
MVDFLGQTRSPQGRTSWQQSDIKVGILGEFPAQERTATATHAPVR